MNKNDREWVLNRRQQISQEYEVCVDNIISCENQLKALRIKRDTISGALAALNEVVSNLCEDNT